jgi:hypothetical protein
LREGVSKAGLGNQKYPADMSGFFVLKLHILKGNWTFEIKRKKDDQNYAPIFII